MVGIFINGCIFQDNQMKDVPIDSNGLVIVEYKFVNLGM
jgi:hypothetical protein